jgi:hypothetical protein
MLREGLFTFVARRWAACAAVVAALLSPRLAAAEDKVEVTITPGGQPWTIGGRGDAECDPTCRMTLARDKYEVIVGEAKTTFLLQVPTEITYEPGNPKLRTIAGWTAVGGVGVGAVFVGFGAYGLLNACAHTGACQDGITVSRPVAEGLVIGAAALISISVAGGIVFALSGESIRVKELAPVPDAPRRKGFDVMLRPASRGAGLELVHRF